MAELREPAPGEQPNKDGQFSENKGLDVQTVTTPPLAKPKPKTDTETDTAEFTPPTIDD